MEWQDGVLRRLYDGKVRLNLFNMQYYGDF